MSAVQPVWWLAPKPATITSTILLADVRHDEADNHANYDIHPRGDRFVMPVLAASTGLLAVFDWASFSAERNR